MRGRRLARRLYDARKELCERLNLRSIAFGARIAGYHTYRGHAYAQAVRAEGEGPRNSGCGA